MKKTGILLVLALLTVSISAQNKSHKGEHYKKAKNIILLIGDGMGLSQIYAGMTANKGHLNMERCKDIGFSKTYSANDFITDSGAGGTAISTGYKTYDHAIGVDKDTIPRETILEYAEENGKATGLVVTSTITHATPAAFISHQPNRNNYEDIATDFLKSDIDVFIGGGLNNFNDRKDHQDLTMQLRDKGYQLVYDTAGLKNITSGKLAGLVFKDSPPKYSDGRGNMLPDASQKAIDMLNQNKKGFFLMIEGSQIDWGGHDNDADYVVNEMLDFDRVVGKVLDFAEKDGKTLVIITADHETGGLGILGGNIAEGKVNCGFLTKDHTGVMVPIFTFGPGSENFKGIYENTEIFHKMMNAFRFEEKSNFPEK